MQGFGKKYRKPSGMRMIFSTNPKGLALLVREEHELPLPVVMGTRLRYARFSRYVYLRKIATRLCGLFRKKYYLCK